METFLGPSVHVLGQGGSRVILPISGDFVIILAACRFADVLPEEAIAQAFADAGSAPQPEPTQDKNLVYTAAVTLWAFLSQVLHKQEQRSCVAAVARVVVLMAALSRDCSDNTGAYCRARARLPLVVIQRLTLQVADGSEQRVPPPWLWKGRHVHLVDGTTTSMPDTPENQTAFPQPPAQKPGLGFPIARLVVLLSLATAMVTGMAMGPYKGKKPARLLCCGNCSIGSVRATSCSATVTTAPTS